MFDYTANDVIKALELSPNVNAALKKLLKNDMEQGDPAEKVLKTLRSKLEIKNKEIAEQYLDKHVPAYEEYVFLWADYALREFTNPVFDAVVEKYAEDFNKTYESEGNEIKFSDKETFDRIGQEAIKMIEQELGEQKLPVSGFTKNIMVYRIFDKPVIKALGID